MSLFPCARVVSNSSFFDMKDEYVVGGFGLLVLLGVILFRVITRDRDRRGLSSTLLKLYGLLSVGGFAVLLAVASTPPEVKASGFTLLGTVAGFLAGANVPDEPNNKTKARATDLRSRRPEPEPEAEPEP
jgi:hypothetical protein